MSQRLYLIAFAIIFTNLIWGQDSIVSPIPIDRNLISGVGLDKIDLKDEPEKDFYQKIVFNGNEIMVFIVSTETWDNKIENYQFDEYVYLLHGQSIVKPKIGESEIFNYGDHVFVPKNFEGNWEIRAGENLHYELAVISKVRSDSTKISDNKLYDKVDRHKLSGSQIKLKDNEIYKEIIREGVELKLSLNAEKPRSEIFKKTIKEQLIYLASGKISIEDSNGKLTEFFAGEFFIVPKGVSGIWKSEGHGLVKYLIVEKS